MGPRARDVVRLDASYRKGAWSSVVCASAQNVGGCSGLRSVLHRSVKRGSSAKGRVSTPTENGPYGGLSH